VTVLLFILRKLASALAVMFTVSLLVYLALEVNVGDVAVKVLGQFSTPAQRAQWLTANGYDDPFIIRYGRWLWSFVTGDWGMSTYYRAPVSQLIPDRLAASGILAGGALLIIVPVGLFAGIIAGMRPGSILDRVISFISIATTSIPGTGRPLGAFPRRARFICPSTRCLPEEGAARRTPRPSMGRTVYMLTRCPSPQAER